jgi:hypothetical protein
MKAYNYNGTTYNAKDFRTVCLLTFPGLQYSRKHTIYENIKRLAAAGNEKAAAFVAKVIEL